MKLGKVETGETKIRIEQDVFNREGREVTRRGAEKMKLLKVRNLETEFRIGPIASGLWPLTSDLSPRCRLCFAFCGRFESAARLDLKLKLKT